MEVEITIKPLFEGKFIVKAKASYEDFKIYDSLDEVLCALSRVNWYPKDPLKDADVRELEESQK